MRVQPLSGESGNAPHLFRGQFLLWHVVVTSYYGLVLLPFLVADRGIIPLRDQLVAQSLVVTALIVAVAIVAGAVAGLARAASFLAGSGRARDHVLRLSSALALSLFIHLSIVFIYHRAGGGDRVLGLFDLLLANGRLRVALACMVVVTYGALGSRIGNRIENAIARMKQLGSVLLLCAVPLVLVFFVQAVGAAWPRERLPSVKAPGQAAGRPNIVVVVLDALPMRKTSLSPGAVDLTPRLRRFADRSVLFANAYAPSNFTTPSVMTLLTGKDPARHGVFLPRMSLHGPSRGESLPAELRNGGFASGAAVANIEAHPHQLKLGGFDRIYPMRGRGWNARLRSAAVLFAADFNLTNVWSFTVENWLRAHIPDPGRQHPWPPDRNFSDAREFISEGKAPRFVYVHVMPPHDPYLSDPPFRYARLPLEGFMDTRDSYVAIIYRSFPETDRPQIGMLERRFEESVLWVDDQLGRFLASLEAEGRFEDSIIVVLSDHGEMFEPRWVGHNSPYLDDVLVHVPLLIHLPGQRTGKTVNAPIGLVDVAPTLLDLEGIPIPSWMDGVSWKPALAGGPAPVRPVHSFTWDAMRALAQGKADSGSCRVTAIGYQAVLDIPTRRAWITDPNGTRIVSFDDPDSAAGDIGPGLHGFEDAVRFICSTGPVDRAGRVPMKSR